MEQQILPFKGESETWDDGKGNFGMVARPGTMGATGTKLGPQQDASQVQTEHASSQIKE